MRVVRARAVIFASLWAVCHASLSIAAPASGSIEAFVRGEGPRDETGHEQRRQERLILLASLPMTEIEHFDIQYDQTFRYRAISLATLIARLSAPAETDTALLHFANGMIIPLPFRDSSAMERLDPFLATAIQIGEGKRSWTSDFPALSRETEETFDARMTEFRHNKIVVKSTWHPLVPARAKTFSPWMYADSLVAVELVAAKPYFRQFGVEHAPQAEPGFVLFNQSCAFCHGVRNVGAKFGWDLIWPTPVFEYKRSLDKLYYHIKYRDPRAPEQGIMMPALGYMTAQDAEAIWSWLKAVARGKMAEYQIQH